MINIFFIFNRLTIPILPIKIGLQIILDGSYLN